MRLPSLDLKKALKAYKAMKSIVKSEFTTFIAGNSECIISTPAAELSIITDVDDYTEDVILAAETITLLEKCKLDGEVEITSDKIKVGSRVIDHVSVNQEVNLWDSDKYKEVAIIPAVELLKAIKTTKYAVAKDETRLVLTNLYWDQNYLVGVDGYRVSTKKLTSHIGQSILLTPTIFNLLEKIIDPKSTDVLKVYLDTESTETKGAAFIFGDYLLSSNMGEGEFLKYQQIFSSDFEVQITANRKSLIEILEFMSIENNPVKFVISKTAVEISVRTTNNTISDVLSVEYESFKLNDPLEIRFNPKYFVESLKNIEDDEVNLKFISSLTPCTVTHSKGKDLILPVRING